MRVNGDNLAKTFEPTAVSANFDAVSLRKRSSAQISKPINFRRVSAEIAEAVKKGRLELAQEQNVFGKIVTQEDEEMESMLKHTNKGAKYQRNQENATQNRSMSASLGATQLGRLYTKSGGIPPVNSRSAFVAGDENDLVDRENDDERNFFGGVAETTTSNKLIKNKSIPIKSDDDEGVKEAENEDSIVEEQEDDREGDLFGRLQSKSDEDYLGNQLCIVTFLLY